MSFLKRFGFYLIGLSLGIVFLAFFFKEKRTEFCYLPNCRVLKDIRSKELIFSDDIKKLMNDQTISKAYFDTLLVEGNVLFNKSDTKAKPCKTYIIEGIIKEQLAEVTIKNCKNGAEISALKFVE
ncbi:hypothetical protein [Zhouia amylolytica]|uniref:DUF4258 domain-containing protein n=1 Tax=Zhouia amylolytica AD3 TaxID=1286632 RepID=W2UN16_9FLAO|nr:hypothetical protein [Zhouia amylolytica]ETN95565.1 hypothetical protein P278_12870 [Zhouia amylolytica AD3]MCQ0110759.1 DUF4258 domain-containing protein [Zhouia amylolytica]